MAATNPQQLLGSFSDQNFLTPTQFAAVMGRSTETIHRWLRTGVCPVEPIRVGEKRVLFPIGAVRRLIEGEAS